jgi:3-oxoacyl-ACP reductase-like protein
MGIFSSIRDAIFGHAKAAPAPQAAPTQAPATPQAQPAAAPQSVDVEEVLTAIMAEKGDPDLNWRSSIVDLMKLLGLDSSLDNRKELATELGYSGAKDGSAEMNIWLHKAVMQELAKNGGMVPAGLAD